MRSHVLSVPALAVIGLLLLGCRVTVSMDPTPGPSAVMHDGYMLDCGPVAEDVCLESADAIDAEWRARNRTIRTESL